MSDGGDGWRWETTVAVGCVLLLPWWVWVTGLNSNAFWEVVLSVAVGLGVGFGIAGLRRGSRSSRAVAGLCLAVQLLALILLVVVGVRDRIVDP
jgi:hypothetical protein